ATTLAGIAFSFFAIDAVTIHPNHMHLALALAGLCACGGFLPFNLRPRGKALVFMGDSGSPVLGFSLAALGLPASWNVAGSQFASFLADVERRTLPGADVRLTDTFAVHWRRLVEVVVDFALISGAFAAAYATRFGWPGTVYQRHIAEVTLPVMIAARYLAFIP